MPLWQRYQSDDGAYYYFNTDTEETTWDEPDGFDHAAADAEDAAEVSNDGVYCATLSKPPFFTRLLVLR